MSTMQSIAQITGTTVKQEAHLKPSPILRKLFTKIFSAFMKIILFSRSK